MPRAATARRHRRRLRGSKFWPAYRRGVRNSARTRLIAAPVDTNDLSLGLGDGPFSDDNAAPRAACRRERTRHLDGIDFALRARLADLGFDLARDYVPAWRGHTGSLGRLSLRAGRGDACAVVSRYRTVAALSPATARVVRGAGHTALRAQLPLRVLGRAVYRFRARGRALLADRVPEYRRRARLLRHARQCTHVARRGAG